jgi:hypothetical protein
MWITKQGCCAGGDVRIAEQVCFEQHGEDHLDQLCSFVPPFVLRVDLVDLLLDFEAAVDEYEDVIDGHRRNELLSLLFFIEEGRFDLAVDFCLLFDIHEVRGNEFADGCDWVDALVLSMFSPVLKL